MTSFANLCDLQFHYVDEEAIDGDRTRNPFLTKEVRYRFATMTLTPHESYKHRVLGGDRTLST
jgi:hypothetical protein